MLLKKLFSFSIGNIISLFIGLISVPIITRIISPEEYGIVTIFLTVMNIILIVVMAGLDQAFVRLYYEASRKDLLRKSLKISLIIALLFSSIAWIMKDKISVYFSIESIYVLLMIIYIFSTIILRYSTIILRMMQKGYKYSLIQIMQKLLELFFILSISFLYISNNFTVIIASIITTIILTITLQFFIRDFWKEQDEQLEKVNFNFLMRYSFPLLISSFLAVLLQSLDKLFLLNFSSNLEVGIYSAAFKIIVILNVIQTSFALFWAPVSNEKYKNNPDDKEFFSQVSAAVSLVMFSVGILVITSKDVIVLMLGVEYRDASNIVAALILMPILYTISETTVVGINFKMKPKLHVLVSAGTLLINVMLCLWLIPLYGGIGAGVAVGISYIVFYGFRTYFGLKHYYFNAKLKANIIMVTSFLLWIVFINLYDSVTVLVLGALTITVILITLFTNEIIYIKDIIQKKLK